MPSVEVVYYRDDDGTSPVADWLADLMRRDPKAAAKCMARLKLLAESGHALRRPHADTLRDGISELRARCGTVQYRLLYFFHGRGISVVAHAITKEGKVPDAAIKLAVKRQAAFKADPKRHTHEIEVGDGQDA